MFKYDRLRICAAPSISAQFTNKLQRKQIEQEPFPISLCTEQVQTASASELLSVYPRHA
ncbi:hypothetical protein B0G74_6810 [Paraburkholderia sp. BL9I2N2]|jgi:hypothetical protein|nr:hypothetical protein B0G74_6810 [Paraburkholderia sp. BL9I2N2]